MEILAILTIFLPLFGFIGGAFAPPFWSQFLTCSFMALTAGGGAALLTGFCLSQKTLLIPLFSWIHLEGFDVSWGLYLDSLSLVMIALVTLISFLVHIYSLGYMKGDPGVPRFMAYLSLFTFFMLVLVTAPNFLQLFFGWEGVGLCSYLLIGYWYDRERANDAAFKAFLMNRLGDVGFILGVLILFTLFGTLEFSSLFDLAKNHQTDTFFFLGAPYHSLTVACLLLFVGAMGKSAQVGFHTWLPEAMEGPTPASALIHAATMVAAGVFLVVRISPLLEYTPFVREVMTSVGAVTALIMATIACVQNDIKKIIAYSTCSQLGYMFMAAGLSGYSAAMFHLTTHAFFKALLFLSAGSIIHAMSDEHNIQKMGGIWRYIPVTYAAMWVGTLALAGIPFFSGFYSKDIILNIEWVSQFPVAKFAFICSISGVFLTAFYACRLLFLTFHGTPKANEAVMGHIHEAPLSMLIPLAILGVGSVISGGVLYSTFVGEGTSFWGKAIFVLSKDNLLATAHHVNMCVEGLPLFQSLAGIFLAYLLYISAKTWPEKLSSSFYPLYKILLEKFYFDELYLFLFVQPSLKLGKFLWERGDQEVLEEVGPRGVSVLSLRTGNLISRLQTGYIYHYAFAMVVGLVIFLGWMTCQDFFRKGGLP